MKVTRKIVDIHFGGPRNASGHRTAKVILDCAHVVRLATFRAYKGHVVCPECTKKLIEFKARAARREQDRRDQEARKDLARWIEDGK